MNSDILIVDDSPILRRSIRRSLNQAGVPDVRIREAGDGARALELVRSGGVSLVLLDLNMPVMNGEATLEALRAEPATAELPVVVVTTEGNLARLMRLQQLGILGYLRKPFQPEDLRKLVGNLLEAA